MQQRDIFQAPSHTAAILLAGDPGCSMGHRLFPGDPPAFGRGLVPRLGGRIGICTRRSGRCRIPSLDKPPCGRDVGTVDSMWEANPDLTSVFPELNLYDYAWPVITHQEQPPSATFVRSHPGRNGVDRGVRIPRGPGVGGNPAKDVRRFCRTPLDVTLLSQRMLDRLKD